MFVCCELFTPYICHNDLKMKTNSEKAVFLFALFSLQICQRRCFFAIVYLKPKTSSDKIRKKTSHGPAPVYILTNRENINVRYNIVLYISILQLVVSNVKNITYRIADKTITYIPIRFNIHIDDIHTCTDCKPFKRPLFYYSL
jgi:hypothetical protein